MRQFQLTPWRIVDLADPDPQMYANFRTGSPVALANYSNPELDKLLDHARVTADPEKRIEDYCAISRIINKEAIWFWTFQNTYYAISTSKLKGLPKIYQRGDRRIATPGWNNLPCCSLSRVGSCT